MNEQEDISQYEVVDTYRNYRYAVWLNSRRGFRCGYVMLNEDHPLYGIHFPLIDDMPVSLSFNGRVKGLNGYYIGWDHNHLWDGVDEDAIRQHHPDEAEELLEYARSMHDYEYGYFYSTKSDVERECHDVIDALIEERYTIRE